VKDILRILVAGCFAAGCQTPPAAPCDQARVAEVVAACIAAGAPIVRDGGCGDAGADTCPALAAIRAACVEQLKEACP
jgi:hypothetical protein